MVDIKIAKQNMLDMLADTIDPALLAKGFTRSKKSITYKRKFPESVQEIHFFADYNPRYEPGAEAHVLPRFWWKIPQVSKGFLRLIGEKNQVPTDSKGIVLGCDISNCAPNEYIERWYTRCREDYEVVGASILAYMEKWFYTYLDNLQDIDDLIRTYETPNLRLIRSTDWHIRIVAAYLLKSENEKAKLVAEKHLSKAGIRKKYGSVFEGL